MKSTKTIAVVTFAIAALVTGLATTGTVQVAEASHRSGHNVGSGDGTPPGEPKGQAVSRGAQTDDIPNDQPGYGDDIHAAFGPGEVSGCRANDASDTSTGLCGPFRDTNASP